MTTLQQHYLKLARERRECSDRMFAEPLPRVERFGRWLDCVPYAAAWFWCAVVPAVVAITTWWLL